MDAATPPTEPAPVREDGSIAEAARRTLTVLAAHIDGFQTSLAKAEAAAERGRLAEVEAAAVPAPVVAPVPDDSCPQTTPPLIYGGNDLDAATPVKTGVAFTNQSGPPRLQLQMSIGRGVEPER